MSLDKYLMTCFYHCGTIQSILTALKMFCVLPVYPLPPKPLATTHLFTVSIVLPFAECHIDGIIQYVACSDWLLSLNNMHLEFLHVFSWFDSSFLFSAE